MINPKIDLVFKKLFGSEENKDLLLSLVNSILPPHQQIASLILKNPYNLSDYLAGKLTILDIKAEDQNGIQYDIEMQIKGTTFYGKRTLYYWAKIFGSQLDDPTEYKINKDKKAKPATYIELKKCIVISLMDFNFFADKEYHRCFVLKNKETNETHQDLDYLDLYFIELKKEKLKRKKIFNYNILERWINFLNNAYKYSYENLPNELLEIDEIKKANKKLQIMQLDPKERQHYEYQQKLFLDENTRQRELEDVHKNLKNALEETKKAEEEAKKAEEETKNALEEAKKAEEEAKKAEEEAKKAKEEAKKAKEAKKEAEEAKKEAEEAKKEAEEAKKEAEEKLKQIEQTKQIEFANNLISMGADDVFIAQATDLKIEEIKKLRKK
ncbi:MAG: Rpn family recombination-promoting nuclease/putative transposase [Bacteroidetes bacterium]|nr:MAG: Rpn family recombination-promoting nuclease/putative transposase [Bacteroidota bacterium]TAG88606.1 MAG: Rpn family recombination-promoting nuclease/putative transposase [Bacteroidota bacterium]